MSLEAIIHLVNSVYPFWESFSEPASAPTLCPPLCAEGPEQYKLTTRREKTSWVRVMGLGMSK